MQLRGRRGQGIAPLLIVSAWILAGCGSVPQSVPPVAEAPVPRQSASPAVSRPLPVLPPAGSGRGAYYQDDGPGDAPPDGLHDMPDARPKVEPYSRTGNRPYKVFGKSYTPFTDGRPFKQRGIGSWYGKKFHGQRTSSGELYDMYKMTAAHPTLPLPSYVRVTNVGNGKQVIVRVNDRGPFHSGRIIDLSYTAALKLGYVAMGRAELEIERLLPDEIARINSGGTARAEDAQAAAPVPPDSGRPMSMSTAPNAAEAMSVQPAAAQQGGNATVSVAGPDAVGGFYLQFGAYGSVANAEAVRHRLAKKWSSALPAPEVVQSGTLYRIYSGPFASRSDADSAARQLEAGGNANPVIVQR
jgi:rare lipoprotein A